MRNAIRIFLHQTTCLAQPIFCNNLVNGKYFKKKNKSQSLKVCSDLLHKFYLKFSHLYRASCYYSFYYQLMHKRIVFKEY